MSNVQRARSETAKTLLIREGLIDFMVDMTSMKYVNRYFYDKSFLLFMRGKISIIRQVDRSLDEAMYGRSPDHTIE